MTSNRVSRNRASSVQAAVFAPLPSVPGQDSVSCSRFRQLCTIRRGISNGTRSEMKRVDPSLLLSILLFANPGAEAQESPQENPQERARDTVGRDLLTCRSSSASRTRPACGEAEEYVFSAKDEITIRISTDRPDTSRCSAGSETEYSQQDTVARVEVAIENAHCAASYSRYTMNASVVDEHGTSSRFEFDEFWQRDDDRTVTFSSEYPIGDNVELVRMWVSGLRCTCGRRLLAGGTGQRQWNRSRPLRPLANRLVARNVAGERGPNRKNGDRQALVVGVADGR